MHTISQQPGRRKPLRATSSYAPGTPSGIVSLIALWRSRHRQRRQLARLDQSMLDDIGVTNWEAAREAAKPFWQA